MEKVAIALKRDEASILIGYGRGRGGLKEGLLRERVYVNLRGRKVLIYRKLLWLVVPA